MEIKNIKVDNVDNSTRAITIKTSGKDIETPNRCISKPEITKLKGMRIKSDEPPSPFEVVDESFHWQIYQPTLEYNSKVRHNLGNINGFSKKTTSVKSTMNIPDNMLEKEESKNILKLIYPKITQKDHIEKLYMDALMEIQYNAGRM